MRGVVERKLWEGKESDCTNQRENGGTLGIVPERINPIYTLYSGIYWYIPFKVLLGGLNS